ncbi:MAG TPA: hypothetical protein PKA00_01375 [Saprospiraceae bacterium]|nr:hypothetical protein [Saprospiraceae bacterium]HMQ81519.1 hypothetical protein [Saprospiraceae bacterium]
MPVFHAFYLKPISGYSSDLRSDTLWGVMIWAAAQLLEQAELDEVLHQSQDGGDKGIFVSSMFTAIDKGENQFERFLPKPLKPVPMAAENWQELGFAEAKERLRDKKQARDKANLLESNWQYEAQQIQGGTATKETEQVKRKEFVNTHVAIDRIYKHTLKLNNGGQLFHTPEYRLELKGKSKGGTPVLYFLATGNTALIRQCLRLLRHLGIGGDRSTGKGTFELLHDESIHFPEPADCNALMSLSLYHPTRQVLEAIQKLSVEGIRQLNYQLVRRQGRFGLSTPSGSRFMKDANTYFAEGSCFPLKAIALEKDCWYSGHNHPAAGGEGIPAIQNGHALFVPVKIL